MLALAFGYPPGYTRSEVTCSRDRDPRLSGWHAAALLRRDTLASICAPGVGRDERRAHSHTWKTCFAAR
jgi:hypothetical protein